jgi:diacylglycerol kinase (ATP)
VSSTRGRPVVVINPESASAVSADELRAALARNGESEQVEWVDTLDLSDDILDDDSVAAPSVFERGRAAAARAVASGASTVIACGDDSTVRACLEAVAGTSTSLAVVSLGPGTLLAANLSIPPGLEAVPGALDGEIRRIDVGEANGEMFAVMAGFGVDVLLGRGDESDGPLSAGEVLEALRSLPRQLTAVTVHVDGVQRFAGRTPCLLVANCPMGPGRATVVPGADPTDELLDLAVVAPRHAAEWPVVWWRLVTGRPQRPEHIRRFTGEWVHVHSWRPRAHELDNDVRPPTSRLDVRVWPGALAVRAPAESSGPPREPEPTSSDTATNGDSPPSTARPPTSTPSPRPTAHLKPASKNAASGGSRRPSGRRVVTEDSDPSTN